MGAAKVAYGIKAEPLGGEMTYVARRYELAVDSENPAEQKYVYSYALKRWKTLELAIIHYSVKGCAVFPIFGRWEEVLDGEVLSKLAAAGFDDMLGRPDSSNG